MMLTRELEEAARYGVLIEVQDELRKQPCNIIAADQDGLMLWTGQLCIALAL